MEFENIPRSKNSAPSSGELQKKALELESKNMAIENMSDRQERDTEIIQLDALNEEVNRLEHLTGISEEEIMATYEKLTKELAVKSIDQLLKELDKSISHQERMSIRDDLNSGNFEKFLNTIKTFFPKKLLLATACALMITTSSWATETTNSQTEDTTIQDYHASQQIKSDLNDSFASENIQISNAESIEKTNQLMTEANQKALRLIEDIDGPSSLSLVPSFLKKAGIKQMAQKAVIDELANNSQAIIEYINDTTKELPPLDNEALELFRIYQNLLIEVDKLNNAEVSTKIKSDISSKLKLITTKDYAKIRKEMS